MEVNLPANGTMILKTKKQGDGGEMILHSTAMNLLAKPDKGLPVKLVTYTY